MCAFACCLTSYQRLGHAFIVAAIDVDLPQLPSHVLDTRQITTINCRMTALPVVIFVMIPKSPPIFPAIYAVLPR